MKVLLIVFMVASIAVLAFAQGYEKVDDKTMKITASVEETVSIDVLLSQKSAYEAALQLNSAKKVELENTLAQINAKIDEAKKLGIGGEVVNDEELLYQ